MVRPSVARAIEGAAPNSPAKLFGRNISARTAKKLTIVPPIKNRARDSEICADMVSSGGTLRFFDSAHCRVSSLASQEFVLLALETVVIDKELFQFMDKLVG